MAVLNDDIKLYIVQALARYESPSQVSEAVSEEFGLKVERSQVQKYDPTKAAGKRLATKYRDIFEAVRKAFIDGVSQTPIAYQNYRLQVLQKNLDHALRGKNVVLANQILEQAAKEAGNAFTNKHLLGNDKENPLLLFYKQISGNTLPVVQDDEIFEGEVVSFDAEPGNESKPKLPRSQSLAIERD